jgi:hypothetical protein
MSAAVRMLAKLCGWSDELDAVYAEVQAKHSKPIAAGKEQPPASDEVEKLAAAIGEASLQETGVFAEIGPAGKEVAAQGTKKEEPKL